MLAAVQLIDVIYVLGAIALLLAIIWLFRHL